MVNSKGGNKKNKCRCVIKSHRGICNQPVRCPHIRPKAEDAVKEEIARKQYFELFCSLKGAPQLASENDKTEEEGEHGRAEGEVGVQTRPRKRIVCHGRRIMRPSRWYVHSFLTEVWSLLTPEMINRLKEMLQTEFGLSPEEADGFIQQQKEKTILPIPERDNDKRRVKGYVVRRGRKCAGIRHYYNDQFSKIVSAKLADYLVASLSARRTTNQRKISEFLLKNLCDVTGEKFTLQYPKTLTHKIMVFFTDRVSGWLAERVAEAEELIRDDREIEELKAAKKKNKKEAKKKKKEGSRTQQNE